MSHDSSALLAAAVPLIAVAAALLVFVVWQPAPLRRLVERHPGRVDTAFRLLNLTLFAGLLVAGERWSALPFLLLAIAGTALGRARR